MILKFTGRVEKIVTGSISEADIWGSATHSCEKSLSFKSAM